MSDLATRFNDAYNARDVDALVALYREDVRGAWHVGPAPLCYTARQDVIAHWQREWVAWPDASHVVRRVVVGDAVAAVQSVWSATNTGVIETPDGIEVPPTHRHVDLECATFYSFIDQTIATFENYWDNMLTFMHMGLMPDLGSSPS